METRDKKDLMSLWSRRRLLRTGSELAVLSALAPGCGPAAPRPGADGANPLGFPPVAPSSADAVIVPDGYRAEVVMRWGDPLFPGKPALDPAAVAGGALLEPGAAAAQAEQFGYNCDGLGVFELPGGEFLLCVNHEFPTPELMFPGYFVALRAREAAQFVREHPQCVAVMQAAVGLSVIHLESGPPWRLKADSPYNRRITAHTPMELSGPASGHELFKSDLDGTGTRVNGTVYNCAAGVTPWGTYLTAEENVDDVFGNRRNATLGAALEAAYGRFRPRGRESRFRWEFGDPRFDVAANPGEALKHGWIVEVDPFDPGAPIKKRTALGRFKHEGATPVVAPDRRVAVYMGDDQAFEYLYKFVTSEAFDPERPEANRDLLDSGTLYAARFAEDGSGEWMPLKWGERPELTPEGGFDTQGDVALRCREVADMQGATPMDRPEDIAVSPITGKVYVACTNNEDRETGEIETGGRRVNGGAQAPNFRVPNTWGHIVELTEEADDPTATRFRWEVFLLAGDPAGGHFLATLDPADASDIGPDSTYFAGYPSPEDLSAFASPDNLGFDGDGNLWITTDGDQPGGNNDGCFVCPTEGAQRGAVKQFMSGPVGCEVAGCEITSDGRNLLLSIQHPGEGGSLEEPVSSWPDGGSAAPRPSLVVVSPEDGNAKLTS